MSTCRVFLCVGRECLLWPLCYLGKTLLAFSLLHSVLQGQICLQVFWLPTFPFQSIPKKMKRTSFWGVSSRRSCAAAAAKSLQSCLTLCDPIDSSPSGSPVPGILQARTLEWVAISFSNAWKWKVKVKSLSCVRPSATPWTAACQAPLSMGFSRQEYWSGVPLPSPKGLC